MPITNLMKDPRAVQGLDTAGGEFCESIIPVRPRRHFCYHPGR